MSTQEQCPSCGQTEVYQASYRGNPISGERNERPTSKLLSLAISIPLAIFSAYMFFRYGPGSGLGLWILGVTVGIATPIYVWKRHHAYAELPEITEQVCVNCGYRWEAIAE